MKKLTAALVAIFLIGLLSAPAHASSERCRSYALCSNSVGWPRGWTSRDGRTFNFMYTGGDGQPGGPFQVDMPTARFFVGRFQFDRNGNFLVRFTVPPSLHAGDYPLRAVGRTRFGSQMTVHTVIRVSKHCFSRSRSGRCTLSVADILAPSSPAALPLGVLGLLLAAAGLVWSIRRRIVRLPVLP